MTKDNDSPETPQDDDIFGSSRGDDGMREMLSKMLDDMSEGEGEEDADGLNQPFDDSAAEIPETVREEAARDILSDADLAKGSKTKATDTGAESKDDARPTPETAEADKGKDTAKAAEGADTQDKADAETKEDGVRSPELASAPLADLVADLPDDKRGEITRRLTEADDALKPFQSAYFKEQAERFGASPQQITGRLAELAEFAAAKPDEYIAWIAMETAASPDKVGDVLSAAAKLHGYRVVKDEAEDDDDLFEDEATKALREENRRLKAQVEGGEPEFGPDAPQRRAAREAQQTVNNLMNERDETGNLKRPLFEKLQPQIAEMARQEMQRLQRPLTGADVAGLYDQAVEDLRSSFGAPDSAAQPTPPVTEQIQTQKAAAAEKAKRASKSLDGTGQGASRRPAVNQGGSLKSQISALWDDLSE